LKICSPRKKALKKKIQMQHPQPYDLWFDRQVRAALGATMKDKKKCSLQLVGRDIFISMVSDLENCLSEHNVTDFELTFNASGWQRTGAFHVKALLNNAMDYMDMVAKELEVRCHPLLKMAPKIRTKDDWKEDLEKRLTDPKKRIQNIKVCPEAPPFYEDDSCQLLFALDIPCLILQIKEPSQPPKLTVSCFSYFYCFLMFGWLCVFIKCCFLFLFFSVLMKSQV
jgi:hypothetical protein